MVAQTTPSPAAMPGARSPRYASVRRSRGSMRKYSVLDLAGRPGRPFAERHTGDPGHRARLTSAPGYRVLHTEHLSVRRVRGPDGASPDRERTQEAFLERELVAPRRCARVDLDEIALVAGPDVSLARCEVAGLQAVDARRRDSFERIDYDTGSGRRRSPTRRRGTRRCAARSGRRRARRRCPDGPATARSWPSRRPKWDRSARRSLGAGWTYVGVPDPHRAGADRDVGRRRGRGESADDLAGLLIDLRDRLVVGIDHPDAALPIATLDGALPSSTLARIAPVSGSSSAAPAEAVPPSS